MLFQRHPTGSNSGAFKPQPRRNEPGLGPCHHLCRFPPLSPPQGLPGYSGQCFICIVMYHFANLSSTSIKLVTSILCSLCFLDQEFSYSAANQYCEQLLHTVSLLNNPWSSSWESLLYMKVFFLIFCAHWMSDKREKMVPSLNCN